MVSFSTGFEQRNVEKVQRTLDALADEPIHVVATTGGIVAPNELGSPPNAIVLNLRGPRSMLTTPSYRESAHQRSTMLAGIDGAANAATEVEELLACESGGHVWVPVQESTGSRREQRQQVA